MNIKVAIAKPKPDGSDGTDKYGCNIYPPPEAREKNKQKTNKKRIILG